MRHLVIRDGERSVDVIVPGAMRVSDTLARLGVRLSPSSRVVRERLGEAIDPASPIAALTDGETVSIVDGHVTESARRTRTRRAQRAPAPSLTAAWWILALVSLLAAALVLLRPELRPTGALSWVVVVLGLAAAASGVLLVVRPSRTSAMAVGASAIAPALVVAASVVVLTRPAEFSATVSVATAAISFGVMCAGMAVLARDAVVRTQLSTLGTIATVIAVVFSAAALMGMPVAAAAAITLGAVPVALRAMPALNRRVCANKFAVMKAP